MRLGRYLMPVGEQESVNKLLFYCGEMSVNYIIDLHKLLFYKRLMRTENVVLMLVFKSAECSIKLLCSKYNVNLTTDSSAVIKQKVKRQFCTVECLIN